MKVRLAGVTHDSIVDGEGLRMVVFAQGCPHHCPGCHNPTTHDFAGGREGDTEQLLKELKENALEQGVTISGGEPFCQCAAMLELAKGAHAMGRDVWAYSGWTFEKLLADEEKAALLRECDVLVDGRYVEAMRTLALPFRGSANQRIIDVQHSLGVGMVVLWEDGA